MVARTRRGQTSVETLLLISVLVIGVVATAYLLIGNSSGIKQGFENMADGARNAYVDPSRAP